MPTPQFLEAAMLACFGLSWPLASLRMLRHRRVEGRGLLPTGLVLAGYLAGMTAKLLQGAGGPPPLFWLYLLNAASVGLNMALQWHFQRQPAPPVPPAGCRPVVDRLLMRP